MYHREGANVVTESLLVQLRKGVLDLCVLALLARQDGYAYDIASRLAEGSAWVKARSTR